jgi:flagellar hook assembly protein FlgD
MEGSEILPAGSLGAGPVVAEWDGLDDDGDRVATGVYLYKVTLEVERPEGDRQIAEQIEKLALIR